VQIPGAIGVDANGDGLFEAFAGITTNAASAEIKGIELETFAILADGFSGEGSSLNFVGTLGYIDAKYKQFIDAFGNDVASFRAVQNTPKWTLSGTLNYATPLVGGLFNASTTLSYRSKTNEFETPSEFLDQPGYALWDASIVWTDGEDRYSIGLHAKNILNKEYIVSGHQSLAVNSTTGVILRNPTTGNPIAAVGREGFANAFYGNPRQVFVTAAIKF